MTSLENPSTLVRGAAEEPDVAGGSTPSRREELRKMAAEAEAQGEASDCPRAQEDKETPALQDPSSPAAGDALSPGCAEEELLEEMLSDKHRWTIFEDAEDEITYLRRRGDVLAHSVLTARAEIEHLHEAGLRLQDAHEALQAEVREMAGDSAYWQALAEARAEELKELKALHTTQQQTSTIKRQQQLCGEDAATTARSPRPGPGSPRCPRMASTSPISRLRRATSDLDSPVSAASQTRRRSTPGALWGVASAKDLQSLSQLKSEDASSTFCQSARPRMQITRPEEAGADAKDSENLEVEEPEDTCQRQDGEVMEHCSDSQELPPALDEKQVNDIDRTAALDDECWMKDPRAALRAAAAEAAKSEKEREERMKKRAADQEQQRQQQDHSQIPLQQVKSLELLPSPAPSGRFVPCQSAQHDARCEESASKQTQQKSRSLGRPSRLSAACRARRDTISLAAKTPPRHRTPPPQQLASRSPQGAIMGSPMGLASALTSSRSSNAIRPRALFSPSASVPGKKWGPGSLSRSCKGLGSPSRRESRVRRGGC